MSRRENTSDRVILVSLLLFYVKVHRAIGSREELCLKFQKRLFMLCTKRLEDVCVVDRRVDHGPRSLPLPSTKSFDVRGRTVN